MTDTITNGRGNELAHIEVRDGIQTCVLTRSRSRHFFAIEGGYPIEERVLAECRDLGVERLVIEVQGGDDVAFNLNQYENGTRHQHGSLPPVRCVPVMEGEFSV